MDITRVGIVMSFGALVAVAGLSLLYFRREQGKNVIRLFGQEFEISTPALVVFLVGCFIFILPSVIQIPDQTAYSFHLLRSRVPETVNSVVDGHTSNSFTSAKIVAVGVTIRGEIANKDQRDFFKFKAGQRLNTRVILTKTSPGGFAARVTVYDNVMSKVAGDYMSGEDPVSFAFQSSPNSYYYAKVEGNTETSVGPYELLIKDE